MSYNSEVIVLVISNHSPDYSLNCTPLSPITITNHRIKSILPVRWFSHDLPVTNGILILECVVLVAENNRSVTWLRNSGGNAGNYTKWYQRTSLRSLGVRFWMFPSDDIYLSWYFKTILNETRISFDGNVTKAAVWISRLVNLSLALLFAGLLF